MPKPDYKKNAAGKCILCWGNGQVINAQNRNAKCPACDGNFQGKESKFKPL